MNLTKTQKAMLLKLAGKIKITPFSINHENTAENVLISKGLAEKYKFEGVVCGEIKTCTGTRITEAGKKLAEITQ